MDHQHQLKIGEQVLRRFCGRDDVIAVDNGSGGFRPDNKFGPLTPQKFQDEHLCGHRCLGFYLLTEDQRVHCACLDFDDKPDNPDPKIRSKVSAIVKELKQHGILALIEISQSGRGIHVWVFFTTPLPAWLPRRFFKGILYKLNLNSVEIYPKQDTLSGKGLGNLIRFPLFNQSHFTDVEFNRLDPLQTLMAVDTLDEQQLRDAAGRAGIKLERPLSTRPSRQPMSLNGHADARPHVSPAVLGLMARNHNLAARWRGDLKGLNDNSRSAAVYSIACILALAGVDEGEIVSALLAHCRQHEYDRTLDWVIYQANAGMKFAASKRLEQQEEMLDGRSRRRGAGG